MHECADAARGGVPRDKHVVMLHAGIRAGHRSPRMPATPPQPMLRASERELREVRRFSKNMFDLLPIFVQDKGVAAPHHLQTTVYQTPGQHTTVILTGLQARRAKSCGRKPRIQRLPK